MLGAKTHRHDRIQREDAADGCVSTVYVLELTEWMCPRCGTPCGKDDYLCHFCSWERKDDHGWKCPDCDHLNKLIEKDCELCGRKKPEGL